MSRTFTIGVASIVDSFSPPPAKPPAPGGPPPDLFFYYLFVTFESISSPQFSISQISADKKNNRPAKGDLANPVPFNTRDILAAIPSSIARPTAAAVLQAKPLPGALVRVRVSTTTSTSFKEEDFDFSPKVNSGQVLLALRSDNPPRLSLAINTTFIPPAAAQGDFDAPGPAEVKAILKHIHDRLLDGPGLAWLGSDGGPELPFGPTVPSSDEENWAKLITEMLITSPYALPSTLYGPSGLSDNAFYMKYLDDDDPGYSICHECQHLVTMAALTRGFNLRVKKGNSGLLVFTAGGSSKGTVENLGGKFLPPGSAATVGDALGSPSDPLTPGSSWTYNGFDKRGEGDNRGSAHIGFAVRVDTTGRRVQTFDTGGLNVHQKAPTTTLGGGTFDDPWVSAFERIPGPTDRAVFKGVCKLPQPPDLATAVERMRKARPLGFARLVLVKRQDLDAVDAQQAKAQVKDPKARMKGPPVIYAGPLLRMHFDGGGQPSNLSYGAYLWSLREHPGLDKICALWLFYTPRGALTDVMLGGIKKLEQKFARTSGPTIGSVATLDTNARGLTVTAMLAAAGINTPVKNALAEVFVALEVKSLADGNVNVARRFNQLEGAVMPTEFPVGYTSLPWGQASGAITLQPADMADMPYLVGD